MNRSVIAAAAAAALAALVAANLPDIRRYLRISRM
ncbi:hypothetical protein [Streptomyces sp. C10-9-1]